MGRLRVISVEGLIGFKLQGFVNDPKRTRDLGDIRALLKVHRRSVKMGELGELGEYFSLFDRADFSMNALNSLAAQAGPAPRGGSAGTVLASQAGIAFQPPRGELRLCVRLQSG